MADQTQENIYGRLVNEVMSRDVVTIGIGDTIHDALNMMGEFRVSVLPVVDSGGACVGILAMSDLVDLTRDVDDELHQLDFVDPSSQRYLLGELARSMGTESVQTFMSDSLTVVDVDTNIAEATRKMLRDSVHHLPVLDTQGNLVGIVSSMDILAEFADGAPD